MCGIVGSFHPATDDLDPWVDDALGQIAHRGPDYRASVTWMAATHGHVRLSILDPHPRSHQPFIYGGVMLSFVGELWNYRQLRERLEGMGWVFQTEGDTEVMAALLNFALGSGEPAGEVLPEVLREMDWMGAFAVTESLTGRTWLARDPLGEVPLYLLEQDGSLFDSAGVRWSSERRVFGQQAAEATPVPAGSVWQLGGGIPDFYWEPERAAHKRVVKDSRRVHALLREATLKRLQADVPIAYLCSGGLDSAYVLSLVAQERTDVVAYVAAMPGYPSADLKAARRFCEQAGVELREVSVRPPWHEEDVIQAIETIELPMKAQVEIAWPCLALAKRISADGFKVVLSGEGADELFGGYGNLARKAVTDTQWRQARVAAVAKNARANCVRTNKVFMRFGVEARLPFMDRALTEYVLPLGVKGCPPHKGLLKEAARGWVPDWVIDRPKVTFQGGSGMDVAMEDLLGGDVVRTYNRLSRELFGAITRG